LEKPGDHPETIQKNPEFFRKIRKSWQLCSGRHCEFTATKIVIYKIVSKSFAYVAIIAMIRVVMFIVMDILKYCFGIDPVHEERQRIRQKKQVNKRKPVIQRFVYVNAPLPPAELSILTIKEITV
jgi:hypothetical protein